MNIIPTIQLNHSNYFSLNDWMVSQKIPGIYGLDNDCRGAPTDWSIYNPDVRDYRKRGSLKRYIGRCLNVKSYTLEINEKELRKAKYKYQLPC